MKYSNEFFEIYDEWIEDGGAMAHTSGQLSGESHDMWYLGDAAEIGEMVTCSPREATEAALSDGGMTDAVS